MHSRLVSNLQKKIPLKIRILLGPFVAYVFYFYYVNIKKNSLKPKILSIEDTISKIQQENLSVIRFGDGEISLIENYSLSFQEKNKELIHSLEKILHSNHDKLLLCILNIWENHIEDLDPKVYWFELHHILKHHTTWERLISPTQQYGDAFITRPYLTIKDKSRSDSIFLSLRSLWKDKDVVLIEGEKARNGVGNNLFSLSKSLTRILCPAENAYSRYSEIKNACMKMDKNCLMLVSLGPTAKPLAYELFLAGYQVIDIGHTDMEYEMFLRQETILSKVPYKYFNEINERNPEECKDETYLSQIVAKIN